ncbi:MAG: uroporphyrinogen decarboxylase family protein [Planctomycetota bacterium]
MNSKEVIRQLLNGLIPERVGVVDAPRPETRKRWREEGLPATVHANDHFGMDVRRQFRVDSSFGLPEKVEEETSEYRIIRTGDGNLEKYWKGTGVPQHLEYGLKDAADWARLRERLTPAPERLSLGYYGDYAYEYISTPYAAVRKAWREFAEKTTTFVTISVPDPYEGFMAKIGDERILTMLLTEPALICEMFDAHVAFTCGMIDLALNEGFQPDAVFVGGDIAYKTGTLFSPQIYRDLLKPRHTAMFQHFHDQSLDVVYHSDGNPTAVVPDLIEAGIDCLNPMEVAAGMDLNTLGEAFGDKICFMGNISVQALSKGPDEVRAEVGPKVRAAVENNWGYIFHSDHSVPPTVPLANYQLALEIVRAEGNY